MESAIIYVHFILYLKMLIYLIDSPGTVSANKILIECSYGYLKMNMLCVPYVNVSEVSFLLIVVLYVTL